MDNLTVLDLFSGCGGMSWGLSKAGFKVLAGIDNWELALNTFNFNHPESQIINGDMTRLNPEDVMEELHLKKGELDCIVGGPPCQGFSKNVPSSYRFLEDPRNQLFRDFLRFVKTLYPKTVCMENVAEIYNAYSGTVRDEIIDILYEAGYEVEVKVIYAPDYGVPQRRRRCFFLASRTGVEPSFSPPQFGPVEKPSLWGSHIVQYRSAWSALSDLPVLENGEGFEPMEYGKEPENEFQSQMRRDSTKIYDHVTRKLKEKQFSRIASLKPGQGLKDLPDHLRPKSGYSGAYGRLDYEMIAPTITRWVFHPGSGRFCHPKEIRLITIREAARLQSFSDDFRFTGTYIQKSQQVGNAVPPLLMEVLARDIKRCCHVGATTAQLPYPLATA